MQPVNYIYYNFDYRNSEYANSFSLAAHVWQQDRKVLNKTFTMNVLKSFVPIFNEKTSVLMKVLDRLVDTPEFDMAEPIFACTLEMVCGKCAEMRIQM